VGNPFLNSLSFDIVIVGAGIVGAACAREFAENGLTTAVIESEAIGGGATAAGMGHIAVMDDSEAQFALTRYSQLLWHELAQRLPQDVEYLPCGAIWVAADEIEMLQVVRKQQYYTNRGVPAEVLDPRSLAEAEPNLRPGMAGALLLKDDAIIYPPCAARFLVMQAQQLGATLMLGRKAINTSGDELHLDNATTVAYGALVLANGIAASSLARAAQLEPRKGHLVITDRHPGFVHHQMIELGYLKSAHSVRADSVAFNVQPRPSGQVLIGSSRQYGLDEPAVDSSMVSAMLRRAFEYMPGLRRLSGIRSWTGFRASTPDKLPLIGPSPDSENIYLATGHEGLGITTSLATAKLLADILLERESAIAREPYLPARSDAVHA
jgi:D-hydroxyproline dehydrogenase subunit beta